MNKIERKVIDRIINRVIKCHWLFVIFCGLVLVGCSGAQDDSSQAPSNNSSSSDGPVKPNTPPVTGSSSGSNSNAVSPSGSTGSSSSGMVDESVASFFYFSYDDSSSTASRDLTHFYIENGEPPQKSWGRAYEYLNAETFNHFSPDMVGLFDVSMGLYTADNADVPAVDSVASGQSLAYFGVNVSGPQLTKEQRPNIVLTLLLDTSGSMSTKYAKRTRDDIPTLLDVAKHGLQSLSESLKEGDVINFVTFATQPKVHLDAVSFSSSFADDFTAKLELIIAKDNTNLGAGITKAYDLALATYDPEKSNRVVILTDARVSAGSVDVAVISRNVIIDQNEGIYFSGIGVGADFKEEFLNELTDAGKGGYSAMITPSDAKRLFTKGFTQFIDDAAKNVRFKITYPKTFTHLVKSSSAEEISQDKDKVQTINFAYNSEQFFLEKFSMMTFSDEDIFELEIEYDGKNSQREKVIVRKTIDELLMQGENEIKSAALVTLLADLVSGRISCVAIKNNKLLSYSSLSDVFAQYQHLINQFCRMK